MAAGRLRFGTQSSADVQLFLTGPDNNNYEKNPVHLHSQILKRLKGFTGKSFTISKSRVIRVTTSHNFDHYLKCIEIMYGEPVDFPNIEECLAILSVASEMSADECINTCMQYLETVPWSAEEDSQIREVLSSEGLKLKISPDLAARLNKEEEDEHINFVEKSMQEMVTLIKGIDLSLSSNRISVQKYLEGVLQQNTCRDVVDVCGRVLLQEFQATVDSRDFSTVNRLFKLIQHCNRGILEAAFRAFCENAELVEYILKHVRSNLRVPSGAVVFDITTWFMKATGDGKIIISRASRVSFLTTWLPIIGTIKRGESIGDKFKEFDKAVLKVVESLPPADQRRICLVWTQVYMLNKIDIATPLTLAGHLQHALPFPNLQQSSEHSFCPYANFICKYLEAVRWSAEEESQIRKVLSSEGLKLKISPDLAARLHQEEDEDRTDFKEKIIREMVSVIKEGSLSTNFETVEKDLRGILNGNASRDFVDACGRVLLQEFKSSIDSRDFTTLGLIFERIKHCNGGILEGAFKAFCEDAEFIEYVKTGPVYGSRSFEIIMWLMNAIGDGKVIISRTSRVSFLTNWLPIMGKAHWNYYEGTTHSRKYKELDGAVVKVVETLPPVDQKSVCLVWAEVYRMNKIDITMPITLSKSL